jgi:hypothetical protein
MAIEGRKVFAYRRPHHSSADSRIQLGEHRAQGRFLFRSEQVVGLAIFSCDSDHVDMVHEFLVHTRFGDAEL